MQAPSIGQSGMTDRGFPIDTIPYDERMGLLPRAGRAGRFRRHTDTGVARVAFVRRARELGLPFEHVPPCCGWPRAPIRPTIARGSPICARWQVCSTPFNLPAWPGRWGRVR